MSIIQVNTIRSKSGSSAPTCDQGIIVSGIATLGTVRVSSGIVTATTGIVTYYGDGQYLSNAGVAVTYIPNNVRVVGVTTFDSQAHIGTGVTINSQGLQIIGITTSGSFQGDGSTLSGIVTTIVAGTNISIVSTGGTGKGSVTISAFDDKGLFVTTPTGISTADSVGIGTTNVIAKLTVDGGANLTGVVTAPTFVGNLTGTASTSTTINLVETNSAATTHYIPFVEAATGGEEPRTDTTLTYIPSSDILGVGNVNATGIVTSGGLSVGTSGTAITATTGGSVAVGRNTSSYVLEVGPTGTDAETVSEYVHGALQTTGDIVAGGDVTITGIITANQYFGNGDGLVGVGSTVQVKEIYWKTVNNIGLSTGIDDWVGGTVWDAFNSVFKFEIGKYGPVNWVLVQCVGGGGAGGCGQYASGGGSGSVVQRLFRAKDLPAQCTFDVGIGGAARSISGTGGDGGDTFFSLATNSEVRAPGGKGGASGVNSSGGNGGEYILNTRFANGIYNVAERGGIFSAAGGAASGTAAYRTGGSSLYGPSGGGAYYNGTGYPGGTSYNPGGIVADTGIGVTTLVGGMGRGGSGASNDSSVGNPGESPGGGGGASNNGQLSGYGGGGILRIWMW